MYLKNYRDLSSCGSARLTRRRSFFPRRTEKNPVAVHLIQFYKELHKLCLLRQPAVKCNHVPKDEISLNGTPINLVLAIQTDEEGLPQLQHSLFMREMRKINPKLSEGCLVVDGLYELVCRHVPWPYTCSADHNMPLRGSPCDLIAMNTSGSLMLERYWQRPDDPHELGQYLTVGASFIQFLHESYGSKGVNNFLRQLDCSTTKPVIDEVHFKGMDLLHLEYKWKSFVEAEVNTSFRLSLVGMFWYLLSRYLIRYWFRLSCVIVILFLDLVITLGFAVLSGRIFQLGFTQGKMVEMAVLAGILVALLIVRFIILNVGSALLVSMAIQVSRELRRQVLARLHAVSPQFLLDHSQPSVLSTFTHDVGAIETLIASSLRAFTRAFLMLLTCLVFSLVVAWPLGVGLIVTFVSSQLLINCLSSLTAKISFVQSQALNKVSSIMLESMDGFIENRVFCSEYYWRIRLEKVLHQEYLPATRRLLFVAEFVTLSQQLAALAIGLFLIIGSSLLAVYKIVEFETGVTVFLFYGPTMVSVATAASLFSNIQAARVGLGRINALLLNTEHNITRSSHRPPVLSLEERKKGAEVEFRNVCHCYSPSASHWILYNVSFTIAAGEKAVIVGESGSGKSSILNLVLDLYLPRSGKVLIAGRETSGTPSKLAVAAFQSNHIFQMSVKDNIRFGNLNASDDDVVKVAKLADIHSWVMCLPHQYDTVVRANTLSGGQKQRIAIARMLLANSPVLVLDEFTSALDSTSERRLFRTVMEVTKERTVIAVTHRVEQAQHFDKILVISHGQVKEIGTHVELMAKRGAYYRMVAKDKKVPSPHKPTPIHRRHSLSHLTSNFDLSMYDMSPSPFLSQPAAVIPNRLRCPPPVRSPLVSQPSSRTPLQTVIEVERDDTSDAGAAVQVTAISNKQEKRPASKCEEEDPLPHPFHSSRTGH